MLPTFLLALIVSAAVEAVTPSCARRGMYGFDNPAAPDVLVQPPMQIDVARCASICRFAPGCGGFASTAKKLPTDWCLIFKEDVKYDEVFGKTVGWSGNDAIPVGFWEASCLRHA
ncbi:hypothetical protein BDU57DRAFT_447346 [Ampelomyces quisqualis]|uniref:Apple domain-containing protein n=1 Tax=Ampelomyces quisqualis TaxID=50730 RepID=A0A6A5QKA8_AMPQU|nr:hypothetical protein BDU57DRAFT_447346 [Ampelomyces quisqualis]